MARLLVNTAQQVNDDEFCLQLNTEDATSRHLYLLIRLHDKRRIHWQAPTTVPFHKSRRCRDVMCQMRHSYEAIFVSEPPNPMNNAAVAPRYCNTYRPHWAHKNRLQHNQNRLYPLDGVSAPCEILVGYLSS